MLLVSGAVKKFISMSNNVELIKFFNTDIINYLPKLGLFKSRLTYFVIFFLTILKLHKLLKRK